jgi:hypothetical protein
MFFVTEQRVALSFATHLQDFLTYSSFNINLNMRLSWSGLETGSSHVEQVPHVTGHAAETPLRAQRVCVCFDPTHVQYLEILCLFSVTNLSLKVESRHVEEANGGELGFALELKRVTPPPHAQHASLAVLPKLL